MTDDEMVALLALAEKATPGPWETHAHMGEDNVFTVGPEQFCTIADVRAGSDDDDLPAQTPHNAAYIAAANPAAVASLVARVRAAEAENADLKSSVVAFCSPWAVELDELLAAANKANEALRRAANECLKAERARRKKLLPDAPATTYCEARIARIEAALAEGVQS